jgi:hypothetical protein
MSLALTGCRSGATPLPEPPTAEALASVDAATRTRLTQALLDEFIRAIGARDRTAFSSLVSKRDPAFGSRAEMIFDNLTVLPLATLRLTARPRFGVLPAGRQRALGPVSWVQEAALSWRLPADSAPAEHTVWLTMVTEADETRLAGTTDIPDSRVQPAPLPLWWLEPVRIERTPNATALVSEALPGNRWGRSANDVVTKIRPAIAGVARGWSGRLVVQVPGSPDAFEQVLGAPDGSVDHIAAVTRADGRNPATAPIRIVVNPVASGKLTQDGVSVLLAHEATHAATHSVDSPAPAWAIEGFADHVAYTAYPDARQGAAASLETEVHASRLPRALPADDRFRASQKHIDLAYTEARLACDYVVENYSSRQLNQLYRQLDRGRTVDQAVRSVLNVSTEEFVEDWRRYLASLGS